MHRVHAEVVRSIRIAVGGRNVRIIDKTINVTEYVFEEMIELYGHIQEFRSGGQSCMQAMVFGA